MTTPTLRRAWQEWRSFADSLDLSDGSPDCATLHSRLFRLSGNHRLDPGELRATHDRLRAAFGPWLDAEPAETAGDLERLRLAMTACEPGWRALLGTKDRRPTDWREVQRVALTAGLTLPPGPLWTSPFSIPGRRFDLLAAQRGRNHAEALTTLDALLHILNHPHGGPLFGWARGTPVLPRPAEALHAAALFRDAAARGALRQEWLTPLGWGPLTGILLDLCQDVTLCLLARLNEPLPGTARAATRQQRGKSSTRGKPARPAPYRRTVPDPLPVEPYLWEIRGSEPFLRAVAEEPLEDVHRLAFADWLEERGHAERGQFIRLQCREEQLPGHPLARRRFAEEGAALFRAHGAAWTAGLPAVKDVTWKEAGNFRRGLLEHLTVWQYVEGKDRPRLFGAVDLRSLHTRLAAWLHNLGDPALSTFLEMPVLSRLLALQLEIPWYTSLTALGEAPALAGLVHLGLPDSSLNYAGRMAVLGETLRLPALSSLDLSANALGEEGARVLAASPVLGNLRRLGLGGCRLGATGIRALASSPALAGLEYLDLTENYGGGVGVASLAASPFLGNLSTLVLDRCADNKGVLALASSPFLKRLTCLGLRSVDLRDDGLRALAASANLASLTVLELGDNGNLGVAGVQALAASPHLAGLRALSLAGVALPLEAVEALARSPHLAGLDTLDLSWTGLDGAAARALVASPHLNNLALLDLTQSPALPAALKRAVRRRWPFARV
jgi:uncharacterized protein (TIGR02996 family)